jgi:hypothetical protein
MATDIGEGYSNIAQPMVERRRMTRDEVVRLMREANTLETIAVAKKAVNDWMQAHPHDLAIAREFEGVLMWESAAFDKDIDLGGDES